MDDGEARFEAASDFVHYASKLDKDTYAHLMRLVVKVQYSALSPNSFRAKIKYVLRDKWDRIPNLLNPLLPDEYQLSQEELLQNAEDYKNLEIIEKYLKFMNQMKRVVKTSEELSFFLELIKSHQRKEIDARELYGSVYNQLGGDFGTMKQLSDIILDEKLTPSYISVPVQLWETSMSEDEVLNKNRLRIDNRIGSVEKIQKVDSNYLYGVDELVRKYLDSTPPTKVPSSWIDDRRYELDLLINMLELAAKEVQRVIDKIDSGEVNEKSVLSNHLRGHSVKARTLRLVERMFPDLKEPREILEGLSKKRLQVEMVLLKINRNIQRHV
ncbi:hypothetical protein QQ045_023462 [Rhodiola kirilowii]